MTSRLRGAALLAGAAASGAMLLAACGAGRQSGGDPGGRRLHQLAADPIFSRLPPGAERTRLQLVPASYQKPGFGAGGWSGPAVRMSFRSASSPQSVYEFYGRQADAEGWTAAGVGSLHIPDRWRKTYPNGALATLSLFTPRPFESAPGPREYRLSGGISLPS